ncbi:hypothetical protein [Streptosporangium sp. NPDC001681]|uniref:hypothetical protein n=1 Tax=Streptosporangium sp. NPDC001681 TaxID=3154395 RepID=UPI00332A7E74
MRLWSVLLSTAALLLAGAVPAQADALADGPEISVAPAGVEPPSYSGLCWPGVEFTASAAITASGPGRQSVSKTWTAPGGESGVWRLEIAGSDGTVVSQSRPYNVPCG